MTLPDQYANIELPIKFMLNSYRALCDGKRGIDHLEEYLNSSEFLLSDWKVIWIGSCTILRTAIALFPVDAKSCINEKIGEEILAEWESIRTNKSDHEIFWEFPRKERDNILHEYEWAAYEVWMGQDGDTQAPPSSLFSVKPEDTKSVLIMRGGPYKGQNSLDLLRESAEWVEARIYAAIGRAGFDPDESRNPTTFRVPPPVMPGTTLLG